MDWTQRADSSWSILGQRLRAQASANSRESDHSIYIVSRDVLRIMSDAQIRSALIGAATDQLQMYDRILVRAAEQAAFKATREAAREADRVAAREAAKRARAAIPKLSAAEIKARDDEIEARREEKRRIKEQRKKDRDTDWIGLMLESAKEVVRVEVLGELLDAEFALGDGTSVTWGDATVEQHEVRVEMLTKMAGGTIETAARHQSAIDHLREANATSLNDLAAA